MKLTYVHVGRDLINITWNHEMYHEDLKAKNVCEWYEVLFLITFQMFILMEN